MGTILIYIIGLTIIEIYLFISIGSEIGAFTTILLIFLTAITGVYYARYEGLKTLKSGFVQLSKSEPPSYEILSGAGIAFAALLLIIPGFLTDLIGKDEIHCNAKSKDRYNRYIGVCYKNDIDLNSEMVINGWAIAYRYYSLDYTKEEDIAKSNKVGIWIGEFVEADCIEPVEDIWTAEGTDQSIVAWDDYISSFAGQAIWDDKKQCLPFGGYWHMLHYRTDLFEAEGLEPPKTFDDVLAAAKLFKDNPKYPDLEGGYAMNMARGSAAGQQFYEWIYSAGGKPWESNYPGSPDAYADQRGLYNSPESVAFIEWMQEMINYMPPGVEQYAWDERAKAFTQGKVAMINNWSVRTPLFNDPEISKVKGKFGVALFPHAAGAESVPPVGGWIACVNKHSKNKEAAWDYLKWFASPEVHREWVLAGAPPSRHSAMNDPQINAEQPWTPVLYESSLRAWQELRPRHALTFELIETLGIEVNKALTGESSAQEAMDTANKKIDRLLKSEGYID